MESIQLVFGKHLGLISYVEFYLKIQAQVNKMKKKTILKVVIVLLCTSIPYLFASFVLWKFDASQYEEGVRASIALVSVVIFAFSSFVAFFDHNNL